MFAKPKWAAGGQNASNQAYVTCNINEPRCTDAPSLNAANSVGTLTSLTSPKARTCKYHVDTRAITPVQKHYVPENPQKPWKEASAETNIRNPHLSTTRQKVQRNKGSNRMINAPEDSSSGHFNPQGMSSSSPSDNWLPSEKFDPFPLESDDSPDSTSLSPSGGRSSSPLVRAFAPLQM